MQNRHKKSILSGDWGSGAGKAVFQYHLFNYINDHYVGCNCRWAFGFNYFSFCLSKHVFSFCFLFLVSTKYCLGLFLSLEDMMVNKVKTTKKKEKLYISQV